MTHVIVPDVKQLQQHYLRQRGGNLPGFQGTRLQRGYGIGSIFKSIARYAIPIVKRAAQAIGRRTLRGAADVAQDVASGKGVRQSFRNRGDEVIKDLTRKGVKTIADQSGGGKRKRGIKSGAKAKTVIRRQAKKLKTSKNLPNTPGVFAKYGPNN